MKKIIFISALSLVLICGCASANATNDSQQKMNQSSCSCEDGTTTVSLTKDNISTYFNVTETGKNGYTMQDFTISFEGVLSFAVYENVIVTLNMHIYAEDGSPYYVAKNDDYERKIQLNAAGEGSSTLYYFDSSIDHVIDTGLGYNNLINYECTWSIKSISGNVKYRL